MPLTEKVYFKAQLDSANRLQIPKCIRSRYKLKTNQYLTVRVNFLGFWGTPQTFHTRIRKDGKITVPKLNLWLLQDKKLDLAGYVADVTLEPF